jgi:hypothetical protein
MVMPPPDPIPIILRNASVKISTDGTITNLKELACVTGHVEIAPDTNVTTVDTMCGSTDYAGTTKWTLTLTLYQSFDVGATEEVLSAAVAGGVPVAWEVYADRNQPISDANPAWSGLANPRPYPPLNGDAGAVSEIPIEWGIIGTPTKSIVPPTMLTGSASSSSASSVAA